MTILTLLLFSTLVFGFLATWHINRLSDPSPTPEAAGAPVSIVIPMRNEASNVRAHLPSVLEAMGEDDELLVMNDGSTDETVEELRKLGVEPVSVPALPSGWLGKHWACWNGANLARRETLLFLDADVSLADDAVRRAAGACEAEDWYSEFPKQSMPTASERLALGPLLAARFAGSLPGERRRSACGQFFAVRRAAYLDSGGHEAIRTEVSDDMALARLLNAKGYTGRLQFGRGLGITRMYAGGVRDVWQGWVKNLAAGADGTPSAFWGIFVCMAVFFCAPAYLAAAYVLDQSQAVLVGFFLLLWAGWLFARAVRPFWSIPAARLPLYVFPVTFFVAVFLRSLFLRRRGYAAMWKGRPV